MGMDFKNCTIENFTSVLSSNEPVPGGGGACALTAATGVSLGCMVCNLTIGKKKFIPVEENLKEALEELEELRDTFNESINKDAQCFIPLSKAYKIPKDDPKRDEILENALRMAAGAPFEVIKSCCRAVEIFEFLRDNSSALVLSDVGVGISMISSAMMSASLNVFINTKLMKDRSYSQNLERETDKMLEEYLPIADDIFSDVMSKIR